jgi:hypothetical protein
MRYSSKTGRSGWLPRRACRNGRKCENRKDPQVSERLGCARMCAQRLGALMPPEEDSGTSRRSCNMKLLPPHFWFRALPPHQFNPCRDCTRLSPVEDSRPGTLGRPPVRQPSAELHCRWMACRARAMTVRPAIGQRGSRSTWLVRPAEPKRSDVMASVPVCARPGRLRTAKIG